MRPSLILLLSVIVLIAISATSAVPTVYLALDGKVAWNGSCGIDRYCSVEGPCLPPSAPTTIVSTSNQDCTVIFASGDYSNTEIDLSLPTSDVSSPSFLRTSFRGVVRGLSVALAAARVFMTGTLADSRVQLPLAGMTMIETDALYASSTTFALRASAPFQAAVNVLVSKSTFTFTSPSLGSLNAQDPPSEVGPEVPTSLFSIIAPSGVQPVTSMLNDFTFVDSVASLSIPGILGNRLLGLLSVTNAAVRSIQITNSNVTVANYLASLSTWTPQLRLTIQNSNVFIAGDTVLKSPESATPFHPLNAPIVDISHSTVTGPAGGIAQLSTDRCVNFKIGASTVRRLGINCQKLDPAAAQCTFQSSGGNFIDNQVCIVGANSQPLTFTATKFQHENPGPSVYTRLRDLDFRISSVQFFSSNPTLKGQFSMEGLVRFDTSCDVVANSLHIRDEFAVANIKLSGTVYLEATAKLTARTGGIFSSRVWSVDGSLHVAGTGERSMSDDAQVVDVRDLYSLTLTPGTQISKLEPIVKVTGGPKFKFLNFIPEFRRTVLVDWNPFKTGGYKPDANFTLIDTVWFVNDTSASSVISLRTTKDTDYTFVGWMAPSDSCQTCYTAHFAYEFPVASPTPVAAPIAPAPSLASPAPIAAPQTPAQPQSPTQTPTPIQAPASPEPQAPVVQPQPFEPRAPEVQVPAPSQAPENAGNCSGTPQPAPGFICSKGQWMLEGDWHLNSVAKLSASAKVTGDVLIGANGELRFEGVHGSLRVDGCVSCASASASSSLWLDYSKGLPDVTTYTQLLVETTQKNCSQSAKTLPLIVVLPPGGNSGCTSTTIYRSYTSTDNRLEVDLKSSFSKCALTVGLAAAFGLIGVLVLAVFVFLAYKLFCARVPRVGPQYEAVMMEDNL